MGRERSGRLYCTLEVALVIDHAYGRRTAGYRELIAIAEEVVTERHFAEPRNDARRAGTWHAPFQGTFGSGPRLTYHD